MIRTCLVILTILTVFSCRKDYEAPVPGIGWALFESPSALNLNNNTRSKLEGLYTINDPSGVFGDSAALKWSYTVTGNDTVYHLSVFCRQEIIFAVLEGRRIDSTSILLKGYWRNMLNTETGSLRCTISATNGARYLLNSALLTPAPGITIDGLYSTGNVEPTTAITLQYNRPLYKAKPFEIVGHRGGGRTSDILPASENTVEIIKMASRFGATGVEIDVRYTKDGIPVLFHDATLNERLIIRNGMLGPIKNYNYAQLKSLVRLKNGEQIPTLREALDAVVYNTPLQYVWLDTKFNGSMQQLRDIQFEYSQKAAALGKTLEINIGIPDKDVLDNFLRLPNYQVTPSVCELTLEDVVKTNSKIWAPRWTLGLQPNEVNQVHAVGKRVFVWTLDVPDNIRTYFRNGNFDGILSNYPSSVAYYYYAKQ